MKLLTSVKRAALISAALTLAGAASPSAFAAPLSNQTQPVQQTPAREKAIHDCNVEASKWSFSSWQSTQIITYDDCMAEHGQVE